MGVPTTMRAARITGHGGPEVLELAEVGVPVPDDQLASLPTAYGTALGMIERGRLREGDTALVSGASGGVGLALVQLARRQHVGKIVLHP